MKKLILIISVSIFCYIFSFCSENQLIINGKVIDASSGQVLPFANVFLKENVTTGTVTGQNGEFTLTVNQSSLTDTLIFSFVGYEDQLFPVSNTLNGFITVYLKPNVQLIEETVVKAKRVISEEFTIEKIEQMDIYMNPLSKADPLLAVNGMASSTTLDESASISLRGAARLKQEYSLMKSLFTMQ